MWVPGGTDPQWPGALPRPGEPRVGDSRGLWSPAYASGLGTGVGGGAPGGCQKTGLCRSVRIAEFFGTNPQVLVPQGGQALRGSQRPQVRSSPAGGGDTDQLAAPLTREVRERTDLRRNKFQETRKPLMCVRVCGSVSVVTLPASRGSESQATRSMCQLTLTSQHPNGCY